MDAQLSCGSQILHKILSKRKLRKTNNKTRQTSIKEVYRKWSSTTFPLIYRVFQVGHSCHVPIQTSCQGMVAYMSKDLPRRF